MSNHSNPQQPFARPTFPTLQSAPAVNRSLFQSYSSTSSSTSSLDAPSPSSAPLPSPSAQTQHRDFFGSLNQQQQPSLLPQQQQQLQSQQQFSQPTQGQSLQRPEEYNYQPNRAGAGQTAAETNNFLSQTGLLAEAAKRAQMACVMRDIEGMEL